MTLPDEEAAKVVTSQWLDSVRWNIVELIDPDISPVTHADVASVLEIVGRLIGALRHERQQHKSLRDAAQALADSANHCRICRECGDGPCCSDCGSEIASDRVGQLIAGGA